MFLTLKAEISEHLGAVKTKAAEWVKPIIQVMTSHVLIQLMGLGISIILVRHLPKEDFAIYTVLMSSLICLKIF